MWALVLTLFLVGCAAPVEPPLLSNLDAASTGAEVAPPQDVSPQRPDTAVASAPDASGSTVDLRLADAAAVDQQLGPFDKAPVSDMREAPAGDGSAGPGAALHSFRYELPCKGAAFVTDSVCPWDIAPWKALGGTSASTSTLNAELSRVFDGDPVVTYTVTIRVRGVAETNTHFTSAGAIDQTVTPAPHLHVGGKLASSHNSYFLTVSEPKQIYFWNGFHEVVPAMVVDYTASIKIRGGAMLTFAMSDSNNLVYANLKKLVAADVPPAPKPFNGQFLQLDVVSVTH